MAFNLADMVNNRKQPAKTENISDTVYRDVFELEPSKENFYSTDPEKLEGLKNSILLFGVMQDILIEEVDGKDRIISGHCRTMCCRMLVEEGHEEFRKINCKYTKVNLNTEELPEDKDGKLEQLLNKLGIIQANRFREKSDWEKMQEALITEEVIKDLRELVDLQGTTRKMVQATLGTSGTQLERYHAIQKKLSSEFMQEFQSGKINISVARELTDLDDLLPDPKEEWPYYGADEVFTPDIARMINAFLEDVYLRMYAGATRRFSAMGAEFAAVQRPKEKDFAFYNEKGEKVCRISAERMKEEYQKRVVDAADLKKPSEEEEKYLDNLARKLIGDFEEWFKQDFHKRVLNVVTSPEELKEKLGGNRSWYFDTWIGIAHAILFDDYVQVWNEGNECLGNYDWFYLAASIQKMWNKIAMEEAEAARSQRVEETVENVSDSDMSECCQLAAENTDERQQDTEENQSLMHDCQEEEHEQEPLDIMGNDIERKAWLRSYKLWGLWYEDKHIDVRYYKYDFENGARLIVEEYDPEPREWYNPGESYYMHLVGGPKPENHKWAFHARYNKYPNSETELVEFLKALQKGKR